MKVTDPHTGIEYLVIVQKKYKNAKCYKEDKVIRRRIIKTCVVLVINLPNGDGPTIAPMTFSGKTKQHVFDRYCQLQGKRFAFSDLLTKIKEYDASSPGIMTSKRSRTAVWRIGEVYAGIREMADVMDGLPFEE